MRRFCMLCFSFVCALALTACSSVLGESYEISSVYGDTVKFTVPSDVDFVCKELGNSLSIESSDKSWDVLVQLLPSSLYEINCSLEACGTQVAGSVSGHDYWFSEDGGLLIVDMTENYLCFYDIDGCSSETLAEIVESSTLK